MSKKKKLSSEEWNKALERLIANMDASDIDLTDARTRYILRLPDLEPDYSEIISRIKEIFEESRIEGKVIQTEPVVSYVKDDYADISLLVIVYQNEISDNLIEEIKRPLKDLEKETGKDIAVKVVSLHGWENLVAEESFYADMKNWKETLYEYVDHSPGLDAAIEDVKNGNLSSYTSVDEMFDDILNSPDKNDEDWFQYN